MTSGAAPIAIVPSDTVAAFRQSLRGSSLAPGDDGYVEARTHRNGMIQRAPGLIVRASGVADVMACVNLAREHGLLLSVRGGGHNVAGNALNDGGLVIDLSAMRAVRVDPSTGRVWAQGGATWGDMDRETQAFGLAVPGGVVSTTGIGGLTLHGGMGHLRRKYGMSIDNLLAVDVVTADGRLRHASVDEHADLFWAVRGAGSNFGVVTGFEFQGHPVGPVVQVAAVFYEAIDAAAIIRGWRDATTSLPDDVSTICIPWNVPAGPPFPDALHGTPTVVVAGAFAGDPADGQTALQPLRALGPTLLDLSGPWPWAALQSGFDALFPVGRHYYWKSTFVDDLSDAAVDAIAASHATRIGPLSDIVMWHLGGAMGRVDPSATPYARRDAPYLVTAEASWDDAGEDAAQVAWARASLAAWQPFSRGGSYINFPGFGEEKEEMLRAAFGANFDRLKAVKRQYDPANLFRMNLNIAPE